jgi:hypothetical protein
VAIAEKKLAEDLAKLNSKAGKVTTAAREKDCRGRGGRNGNRGGCGRRRVGASEPGRQDNEIG